MVFQSIILEAIQLLFGELYSLRQYWNMMQNWKQIFMVFGEDENIDSQGCFQVSKGLGQRVSRGPLPSLATCHFMSLFLTYLLPCSPPVCKPSPCPCRHLIACCFSFCNNLYTSTAAVHHIFSLPQHCWEACAVRRVDGKALTSDWARNGRWWWGLVTVVPTQIPKPWQLPHLGEC